LKEALNAIVQQGMVIPQLQRQGRYAFAHDRIQQAAYKLIPEEEQAATHLRIGRQLYQSFAEDEYRENIFLVVNQLIRGSSLLEESDKTGLAALCLQAGQTATLSGDYNTGILYFKEGTKLLHHDETRRRHWRQDYQLCLDLYNSLAEAECCIADFDNMDMAVQEVLDHARSSLDKGRAQTTKVYALAARFQMLEAIALGIQVLRTLGESFPTKTRIIYLLVEITRTKMGLRGKTDEDLLSLPDIRDPGKIAAMGILNLLTTFAFQTRPDLFPFIVLRMINLSLKHGMCAIAAPGFAFYGLLLCALGEVEEGYRFGQFSLRLLERFQRARTEWLPRVYLVTHGMVGIWKQPLR